MKTVADLIETATPPALPGLPLGRWLTVARERRALARLTDRELADIGLDAAAARAEAGRPFWDLPAGR